LLKPCAEWICDKCHGLIAKPEEGSLEWLRDEDGKVHSFKIVHRKLFSPIFDKEAHPDEQKHCYHYDRIKSHMDDHLDRFMGTVGIVRMLSFIGPSPDHKPDYKGPQVKDPREWAELYRRLFLPHYEAARQFWEHAETDGYFKGISDSSIYLPETLENLVETFR
jgi:hypothetical protein